MLANPIEEDFDVGLIIRFDVLFGMIGHGDDQMPSSSTAGSPLDALPSIRNGLDPARFRDDAASAGNESATKAEGLTVAMVANLRPETGLEYRSSSGVGGILRHYARGLSERLSTYASDLRLESLPTRRS